MYVGEIWGVNDVYCSRVDNGFFVVFDGMCFVCCDKVCVDVGEIGVYCLCCQDGVVIGDGFGQCNWVVVEFVDFVDQCEWVECFGMVVCFGVDQD